MERCDPIADLKKCDLLPDWNEVAHERGAWQSLVKEAAAELNRSLEMSETQRKDEKKQRREDGVQPGRSPFTCSEPGYAFVGQPKAGLVNHTRQ